MTSVNLLLRMRLGIRANLGLSRFRVGNQRFFCINRSQHSCLLEHYLKLHLALLIDSVLLAAARIDERLAPLTPILLDLIFGYLLAWRHRIIGLHVLQEF